MRGQKVLIFFKTKSLPLKFSTLIGQNCSLNNPISISEKKSPDVSSFGVKSSATKCPHLILTLAAADFPNFPVFNTLKVFSSGCNLDYGTRLPRLLYPRKTQIHKCINTQIHK